MGWLDPRRWGGAPLPPVERLSTREWVRMYRILGLPEDASRERVMKATSRLRKKYAENEEAIERVENANLWIMTRLISRNEEAVRKQQQANRLREIGDSPRKLFQKYIAGYIPPNIRQMVEAPSWKHLQRVSGLLGFFALMGLCVPQGGTNFVGLGAAATMGLVYLRSRPEPVKDDMGNAGEVKKLNFKEMFASIVVTVLGAALGTGISIAVSYFVDAPFEALFCLTTCSMLWLVALFFKVYQCFD